MRARRAMSRELGARAALVALVRRNRRRYGGYLVHAGVARAVRRRRRLVGVPAARRVQLRPGQTTQVGDYAVTYVKPTGDVVAARNGRLERIDLGAVLRVARAASRHDARHLQSYFPSHGPEPRAGLALLRGRGDERGRAATPGCGATSGPRWRPTSAAAADHRAGRQGVRARRDEPADDAAQRVPRAGAARLSAPTRSDPPPATFRIIASPLVTWIWLGALIVFLGGADRAVAGAARARRARPATATGRARGARARARA